MGDGVGDRARRRRNREINLFNHGDYRMTNVRMEAAEWSKSKAWAELVRILRDPTDDSDALAVNVANGIEVLVKAMIDERLKPTLTMETTA